MFEKGQIMFMLMVLILIGGIIILAGIVFNSMCEDISPKERAFRNVILSGGLIIMSGLAMQLTEEGRLGNPEYFNRNTYYKVIGVGVVNSPTTPVLLQRPDNSIVALRFDDPVTVTNGTICKLVRVQNNKYTLDPFASLKPVLSPTSNNAGRFLIF